ncbi:DUF4240 domain-containing protein [Streptomyces sp. NPDC055056]
MADLTLRDVEPFPQSADTFLYSRCAVVAAGQSAWESVFFDVDKFAPYTASTHDGESLLFVSDQANELAIDREWDRSTRYCFETFSNRNGWPHLQA